MTIELLEKEIVTPKLPDITQVIARVMAKYARGLVDVYGDSQWTTEQAKTLTKAWLDVELERSVGLSHEIYNSIS